MEHASGKPRQKRLKPETFWLPAIFLFLLGLGNALIGQMKMGQFEEALAELDSAQQYKEEVSSSPLMRMQIARRLTDSRISTQLQYEERWNFYRTVRFGGKVVMALSLLLFSISFFVVWMDPRRHRPRIIIHLLKREARR